MSNNIYSRISKIYNPDLLRDKLVTVVGLGSIGSTAAVMLAKSGVRHFRIIDPDIVSEHNVIRHECGLNDVGRKKCDAVADLICNRATDASIERWPYAIPGEFADADKAVAGADLIVAVTDTVQSKRAINLSALVAGIPAVYAGAYTKACAGEVYRVMPGESACFDCIHHLFKRHEIGEPTKYERQTYGEGDSDESPAEIPAEPGLGIHVGYLAVFMADMALRTLLKGVNSAVSDMEYNFYVFGIYPAAGLESFYTESIEVKPMDIPMQKDCLTCSMAGYQNVDISRIL